MKNKTGQISIAGMLPMIVIFAVAILALSLITGVIQDVSDSQPANSTSQNISINGMSGMTNIAGQFGNIGQIMAIVVIIGLLVGSFVMFQQR